MSPELQSRRETRLSIAAYIEDYYNVRRRYSYLDYATPLEYELRAGEAVESVHGIESTP